MTAVCGWFKSSLKRLTDLRERIPHDGSLWMVQVQPTKDSLL